MNALHFSLLFTFSMDLLIKVYAQSFPNEGGWNMSLFFSAWLDNTTLTEICMNTELLQVCFCCITRLHNTALSALFHTHMISQTLWLVSLLLTRWDIVQLFPSQPEKVASFTHLAPGHCWLSGFKLAISWHVCAAPLVIRLWVASDRRHQNGTFLFRDTIFLIHYLFISFLVHCSPSSGV